VVEVDGSRPWVVRTGIRSDDTLPEIGGLKAFVSQVMFDTFDHRPLEEKLSSFVVVAKPSLELVAGGSAADPEILTAGRPKCVAKAPFHLAERSPPREISGCEPLDFSFAARVVIPELNAGAVIKRNEHSGTGRQPMETVSGHVELIDDKRVKESG
jgi:hypothetical protein